MKSIVYLPGDSILESRKYGIFFSSVFASTFILVTTSSIPKEFHFWKTNQTLSVPYLIILSAPKKVWMISKFRLLGMAFKALAI